MIFISFQWGDVYCIKPVWYLISSARNMWEKGSLFKALALGRWGNILRFIRLLHGVDMENTVCFCEIDCDRKSWHDENHCFFCRSINILWLILDSYSFVENQWNWEDPFTNTVVALLVVMSIRKGLVQKHCVCFYSSRAVATFCPPYADSHAEIPLNVLVDIWM